MSKLVGLLALAGIIAPVLMFILWIVAGLLRPGYDPLTQYGSELGTGTNALVMNANFVVTGMLIVALAFGLFEGIHGGKWPKIGAILVGIFGVGEIGAAVFPCDPGCPIAGGSSSQSLHNLVSVVAFVGITAAPLAVSIGLKRDRLWEPYQSYSLVTGISSAGLFLAFSGAVVSSFQYVGLLQWLFLTVPFVWLEAMAIRLLGVSNGDL